MAAAPCPRRLPRLLGAAVVLALTVGLWGLAASPSRAATTHTVEVQNRSEGTLHPASLEIQAGDTVVWEWVANEYHAVTVTGHGSTACNPLDSADAPCDGHTLEITFEEAGEFAVRDDAPFGSSGTVVVAAPPPPKPTPPPPSPTASPSPSQPAPSDPGTSEPTDPEPTSSAPSTEPSPPPPTEPPPPQPTSGTAVPPPVDTEPDPTPTADDPAVASADDSPSPVPDPTFEDFPEPVDPTPADDVEGEVAVGSPADDDDARMVWGVVGGLTVLGTLGAFGRAVLFSEPWDV